MSQSGGRVSATRVGGRVSESDCCSNLNPVSGTRAQHEDMLRCCQSCASSSHPLWTFVRLRLHNVGFPAVGIRYRSKSTN